MATHRYLCHLAALRPVKQVVEEVKGHRRNLQSSGSVGLQNVWKGLRTLSRTGAMGIRELYVYELARA